MPFAQVESMPPTIEQMESVFSKYRTSKQVYLTTQRTDDAFFRELERQGYIVRVPVQLRLPFDDEAPEWR